MDGTEVTISGDIRKCAQCIANKLVRLILQVGIQLVSCDFSLFFCPFHSFYSYFACNALCTTDIFLFCLPLCYFLETTVTASSLHSWEMFVKSQTYSTVYAWGHALTPIIYSLYPWFWNGVPMNRSPFAFAVCVCICDDYVSEYMFLCLPVYGVVVMCMSLHIPPSRWFSLLYLICVMYF